jgi:uncharacterized protein
MALAPVSSSERVPILDVLRGLALYGVLTANLVWNYSGLELLPPERAGDNRIAGVFLNMFVNGRAISTLTFLFGLGFALQLARADERGEAVRGVFVRRLFAMLMFGAAHVLLLWWGDILWCYATCGFALLWFRRSSGRALLVWAAVLILVPHIVGRLPGVADVLAAVVSRPANEQAFNAEMLAAFAGDDHVAVTKAHLRKIASHIGPMLFWFLPWILGHFLLGLAAGKARLFEGDGAGHRKLFRRLLVIGGVLAVIGTVAMVTIRPGRGGFRALPLITRLGLSTLNEIVTLGVVAIYISAVVLLMQRRLPRRLLMILAPVGRMPLTTYLSQSLIGTFVFYGWGLGWLGEVDMAGGVAIAAGIFAVQVVIANLWLRRFRSGPLEWLWRAITYRARPRDGARGESSADASTMA